jgi:regulator of replication initiation timing
MKTQDIIESLRDDQFEIMRAAADRLEELQKEIKQLEKACNEQAARRMEIRADLGIVISERDAARAEVERVRKKSNEHHIRERDDFAYSFQRVYAEIDRLKQALHDARLENSGQSAQLERTRPEPSRLEIAAMFMTSDFCDDESMALQFADQLIAAAKETK